MKPPPRPSRSPILGVALLALVIASGLGSRRFGRHLPRFVAAYAGDTLWALAAFLAFGLALPRASTRTIAALAMSAATLVEFGQLYHAPWIDSIRRTTLGGLFLGQGFLASDLACYAAGVGLGVLLEVGMDRIRGLRPAPPIRGEDGPAGRP